MKRKITSLLKKQEEIAEVLRLVQSRPATKNEQTIRNRGKLGAALLIEYFEIGREVGFLQTRLQKL